MAAPGGLLFAKLIIPETDKPNNQVMNFEQGEEPANVLDAAAVGASSGVKLALNVGAMLLAFIGLIAVAHHERDLVPFFETHAHQMLAQSHRIFLKLAIG